MSFVYLGVGSNLGEREANIQRGVDLLKEHKDIEVLSISSLIETRPEGGPPQGNYLNGVLHIRTDLMPLELLSQLKIIERKLGRSKGEPNGPRPLDLDILFYDDVVIARGKNLNIPHPKLVSRRFVLQPLVEIAPDFIHPRLQKTVRELYDDLPAVPDAGAQAS